VVRKKQKETGTRLFKIAPICEYYASVARRGETYELFYVFDRDFKGRVKK
jgi:hypothetical protein